MDAPTVSNPDPDAAALLAAAKQLHDLQLEAGLSPAAWVRSYSGLGSSKLWAKILTGDFTGVDVERQRHNYEQVLILALAARSLETNEPIFDDLPHMVAGRLAVTDAVAETGNSRLVIIQGRTGDGKTSIAESLAQRWTAAVRLNGHPSWEQNYNAMLTDTLAAIPTIQRAAKEGERPPAAPASMAAKETAIIKLLAAKKRILLFDEFHHVCRDGLNFVKTIINETATVPVVFCVPKLWRDIEKNKETHEEVLQLTRNRLSERVILSHPTSENVLQFFLKRGVAWSDAKASKIGAAALSAASEHYGSWKFLNHVTRRALREIAPDPIDAEQVAALIKTEQSRR